MTAAANRTTRFHVAGLDRRRGTRRRRAPGDDPKLNAVGLTEPAVDDDDTRLVDATLLHQVVARARHEQFDLPDRTGASTVGNDVTGGRRIVLKFRAQVIESRFLIVEGAVLA